LINSIALTVTGNKSVRRCKKNLCAGLKLARNILTNLSPNPARPNLHLCFGWTIHREKKFRPEG